MTDRLDHGINWLLRQPVITRSFVALIVIIAAQALPAPVRAPITLPLLLTMPGFALLSALRVPRGSDTVTTIGLSIISSIGVLSICALALHASGVDIGQVSLLLALVIAWLLLAAVASWHAERADPTRFAVRALPGVPLLTHLAGAGLLVTVLVLALPGTPARPFTQLALDRGAARTADIIVIPPGRRAAIPVAVTNDSAEARRYTLRPTIDGGSFAPVEIEVGARETWRGRVEGSIPAGGCAHRLTIALEGRATKLPGLVLWLREDVPLPSACRIA